MLKLRVNMRRISRAPLVAAFAVLVATVVLAHSPVTAAHGMEMDEPSSDLLTACLAVIALVGSAAVLVVAMARGRRPWRMAALDRWPGVTLPAAPRAQARARAGPARLQVFRL